MLLGNLISALFLDVLFFLAQGFTVGAGDLANLHRLEIGVGGEELLRTEAPEQDELVFWAGNSLSLIGLSRGYCAGWVWRHSLT